VEHINIVDDNNDPNNDNIKNLNSIITFIQKYKETKRKNKR